MPVTRTLLITSGAYVEPELEAEFGRLPPAFLPIGNRRLFVHQHRLVRDAADRILLSLPEDFTPDPIDAQLLAELGIEIVPVPAGLSLGQSVVYAMNMTAASGPPFRILHGDTLLRGVDLDADDAISVDRALPGYRWGQVDPAGEDLVLTGYFAFADSARLVQEITRAGGGFVAGVLAYARARPLRHLVAAQWLDCGHVNTYHRSRRSLTTEREFNHLAATGRSVVKSGTNHRKIEAEASWFETLPPPLRIYTPAFLGRGPGPAPSYALEYLHHPTLADLFVFGRLEPRTWERILAGCDEFLSGCAGRPAPPDAPTGPDLYLAKTMERLEAHAQATGLDLDAPCRLNGQPLPSLTEMARQAAALIPDEPAQTLIHGDFCFSNILYDARADLIRVIDPRGMTPDGQITPYGDLRYDLGKLHHSAVGWYDLIIAGYFRLDRPGPLDFDFTLPADPSRQAVAELFLARDFAGRSVAVAPAISVLLFLSMLPLHRDDPRRQTALLANGLRLFAALDTP